MDATRPVPEDAFGLAQSVRSRLTRIATGGESYVTAAGAKSGLDNLVKAESEIKELEMIYARLVVEFESDAH